MPLITVKQIEQWNPEKRPAHRKFSDLDGTWLRLAKSGRRTFLLSYTAHSGQGRTLTLGMFPLLSPSEAFTAAKIALGRVAQGHDPQAEKVSKRLQAQQDSTDSFSAVLDLYIKDCQQRGQRAWHMKAAALTKHGLPLWKGRPIRSIMQPEVQALINKLDAAHGRDEVRGEKTVRVSSVARNVHGMLSALFNFADKINLLDKVPTNVLVPGVVSSRDRKLAGWELAVILKAIDTLNYPAKPFLSLLLLSGQRRTEISSLSRAEIDLPGRTINFPEDRMKAGKPHSIPITDPMMKLLIDLPLHGQYVFSNDFGKTPINGFAATKKKLDRAISSILVKRNLPPMQPHIFHDYRRSAATVMADLNVGHDACELVLAHKLGDATSQRYVRSKHMVLKAAALTAWQNYLLGLGKTPAVKTA